MILTCPLDVQNELSPEKYKVIENLDIVPHTFQVDYNYWTTEQILYSVMPEGDAETPSSFTTTGHIAHVNLKEENIPYKALIAQVILDVRIYSKHTSLLTRFTRKIKRSRV